jgi:hypothetical protein
MLVLTAAACRGIYGYLILGLGLAAAFLTQTLRTRWVLVALTLVAPLYISLRVSGLWDARSLVNLAESTGRAGTVGFRIEAEDGIMPSVLSKHATLGFGFHIWHAEAAHETITHWPDGWWLLVLWEGGLAGLAVHLAALHLLPAGLALARPPGRPSCLDVGSPTWGLALFTVLHMTDSLHNQSSIAPTALVAGALVGRALGRTSASPRDEGEGPPAANDPGRNMIRLAIVLTLLATPEILDAAARFLKENAIAKARKSRNPPVDPEPPILRQPARQGPALRAPPE